MVAKEPLLTPPMPKRTPTPSPRPLQVPPEIVQVSTNYSTPRPPVNCDRPDQSPILNNNMTFFPDSAPGAPSNSHLAVHRAKTNQVLPDIDQVLTHYSTPRPPVDYYRQDHDSPTISPKATANNKTNTIASTTICPASSRAKNDPIPTKTDGVLTDYSTPRPPVDYYRPDHDSSTISPKTTANIKTDTMPAPPSV